MIQLHFAIGRPSPHRTEGRGPPVAARSAQRQSNHSRPVGLPNSIDATLTFGQPTWYILPSSDEREQYDTTLRMIPYGITNACSTLLRYRTLLDVYTGGHPFQFRGRFPAPFGIDDAFLLGLSDLITLNQRVRWAMKQLVQRWRVRRFRVANTDDFGTLERPKQPVYIYDWPSRTRYTFEAKSIFHDMKERLYHAEYLFPSTLAPRNPFTNIPLTLGQTHFLMQDLQRFGYVDAAMLSFRDAGYQLAAFTSVCHGLLRAAAVRRLFRAPSSLEYQEILYEFIQSQYEYHSIPWIVSYIWKWVVATQEHDLRIQRWKHLCYEYYAALCIEPDATREERLDRVYETSAELTALPLHEMISLYKRRSIQ